MQQYESCGADQPVAEARFLAGQITNEMWLLKSGQVDWKKILELGHALCERAKQGLINQPFDLNKTKSALLALGSRPSSIITTGPFVSAKKAPRLAIPKVKPLLEPAVLFAGDRGLVGRGGE